MALVFKFKEIKPKRLNEKRLRAELEKEMRSVSWEILGQFRKTTKTWKRKPKWDRLFDLKGPGPTILVGTDNEIYRYVDEGTKPHPIYAGIYTGRSNKKVLAFPSKSRPKTRPRVIASYAGFRGGKTIYRPFVQHPGTTPRQFTKVLSERYRNKFKRRMEGAMRRARKASGHAI